MNVKAAAILMICALASAHAIAADADGKKNADQKNDEKSNDQGGAKNSTAGAFFDDWAVGLAVIRPSKTGVTDASIVDGKVRVNATNKSEATILVARHFFPFRAQPDRGERKSKKCMVSAPSTGDFWTECTGAIVAVGLSTEGGSSSNQVVNFAGIGLSIGGGMGSDQASAWHFGIGVGRKFNQKVLGDGFSENAAPPGTETQVRYKTIDVTAPFAFFTVHW